MSAHQLYDTWLRRIRELWPQERITRQRNLAWMVVAMYLSQSVHLPKMASKVPLGIRRRSIEQRFSRFLQNKHFRVRDWYAPVAQQLLCCAAAHGSVHLIIDSTPVGRRYQLLMVGLAYRKRALPLAWSWLRGKRGHSSAAKQRALLNYVHDLAIGATVVPVGGQRVREHRNAQATGTVGLVLCSAPEGQRRARNPKFPRAWGVYNVTAWGERISPHPQRLCINRLIAIL